MHQRRPRACLAWIGDGYNLQSMNHPAVSLFNKMMRVFQRTAGVHIPSQIGPAPIPAPKMTQ